MFYMTVGRWPLSSSEQVGKATIEAMQKPLPDYLKRIGHYVAPTAEGIKSIVLFEAEKGHNEAFGFLADYYAAYRVVDGFNISIEPLLTVAEAMPMLGLKL